MAKRVIENLSALTKQLNTILKESIIVLRTGKEDRIELPMVVITVVKKAMLQGTAHLVCLDLIETEEIELHLTEMVLKVVIIVVKKVTLL